jgi:hypothetical protein
MKRAAPFSRTGEPPVGKPQPEGKKIGDNGIKKGRHRENNVQNGVRTQPCSRRNAAFEGTSGTNSNGNAENGKPQKAAR